MSEERLNHYKEWIEDNEEIVVDSSVFEELVKEIERLNNIIKEVREYIVNNRDSDSFTELTSGKITDIEYCIPAFEDILEIVDKGDETVSTL